jgi:hypothetical protein
MASEENPNLYKIRHYKGTVADFKSYWDEKAGTNTNAFNTPAYQDFNNVHPTRGSQQSPHLKDNNVLEQDNQDHEVSMAQKLLTSLINDSLNLQEKIGKQEKDIPAWIQDHISQAYNYLKQASDGYHEL